MQTADGALPASDAFYPALLVISAMAQDTPAVTISPASGEVESAVFTIEIDGLLPDTALHRSRSCSKAKSSSAARKPATKPVTFPYPISSTEGDAPGAYHPAGPPPRPVDRQWRTSR